MTSFLDFTLMPDSQKIRKVKEIKYNEYSPGKDYWKKLRDKIVNIHAMNNDFSQLDNLLHDIPVNRINNYKEAIKGYRRFLKRYKDFKWFDVQSKLWVYDNLAISVNPELGLFIDGEPYLIKLYFKETTTPAEINLTKSRSANIAFLMFDCLRDDCPEGTKMAVLNVKKGNLIVPDFNVNDQKISIQGSSVHFLAIWEQV